ncbi:MAG TPA: quinol:electron acceptor oxidoreductase subunit ActD [Anaeromyxobacter sp.]
MREDLVAIYADPRAALRALDALHGEDVTTAQIASSAPLPGAHAEGSHDRSSTLGWIALCGALTGLGCAMALQVATSDSLGLLVGAKPIVSWTAFGVVMFELTMLFAGAANFIALIVLCAVARRQVSRRARDEVSSERIVVVVRARHFAERRRAAIRECLEGTAAEVQG